MAGRVLYVTYGDLLSNVYGSQMEPLWRNLKKRDVPISVFSFLSPWFAVKPGLKDRLRARIQKSSVPLEVSYWGAGFPPKWEGKLVSTLWDKIRAVSPDVVHARGPVAAGLVARALGPVKKPGAPRLIYDVRGDTIAELKLGGLATAENIGAVSRMKRLEADAVERASELFCVSSPLVEMIQREYGGQKGLPNSTVIPCWAEIPSSWSPPTDVSRETIREKLEIRENKWIWCYAGSVARWQGLSQMMKMIEALHLEDDRHIAFFITDDPDGMRGEAERMGVPEKAYRIFSLNREKTVELMSACDAGILLREKNDINRVACPMKFADYLLAGLPVLASAGIGDLDDWILNFQTGALVFAMDVVELKRKALGLTESVRKRGRGETRAKALSLCREKLAFDLYAQEYISAYQGRAS